MTLAKRLLAATAVAVALGSASQAGAVTVNWVDWTTVLTNQNVIGTIATTGGPVGVTYAGSRDFAQVTGGGTDYWNDNLANPYTEGLINRPTGTDIIALGAGSNADNVKTITFSHAVSDLYVAFMSWNGNTAQFNAPFSIVSNGCSVFGCGSFAPFNNDTGFFGSGETAGVLKFGGPITQLRFTDTTEHWHGFTVGLAAAPEPSTWALTILGFAAAGAALRRRRTALA